MLLQQGGYACLLCSLEHGAAGVAAHADGYVGLEFIENLLCHAHALEQLKHHFHILEQILAIEAIHGQTDDAVACSWHFFHFHTALSAHKQDVGIGVATAYFAGNRQGGEYVATGATSAHENVELFSVIVHC